MSKSPFWPSEKVEFLAHFLSREDAPGHAMDVTMLDGYLTAVVSGSNLIMPSEMLRWVWDTQNGQEDAHFKDQAEAEEVMGLEMKQWNAIAKTLTQSPKQYVPQLPERQQEASGQVPKPIRRDAPKLGRNDPCHCSSGRKYKRLKDLEPDTEPAPLFEAKSKRKFTV